MPTRQLSTFAMAAIFAIAAIFGGCRWIDDLRGDNFSDEFAHWGENQRQPTSPGQTYGFSTEARQVERNLGVR
jgi:hypothetical protein